MADEITQRTLQEIEPLHVGDSVAYSAHRIIEADLPGLPVVDDDGKFKGIFGEREFMTALFPSYLNTLSSASMLSRTIDEAIERREGCGDDSIDEYLTTDHVVVEDDYADTQLAELFLHHRVLIIPIATKGKVHAVVTRNDFFKALAEKITHPIEDFGD